MSKTKSKTSEAKRRTVDIFVVAKLADRFAVVASSPTGAQATIELCKDKDDAEDLAFWLNNTLRVRAAERERDQEKTKAAFDRVANPKGWKLPINKILPKLTAKEQSEIDDAVAYYTGAPTTFTPVGKNKVRVESIGYYASMGEG